MKRYLKPLALIVCAVGLSLFFFQNCSNSKMETYNFDDVIPQKIVENAIMSTEPVAKVVYEASGWLPDSNPTSVVGKFVEIDLVNKLVKAERHLQNGEVCTKQLIYTDVNVTAAQRLFLGLQFEPVDVTVSSVDQGRFEITVDRVNGTQDKYLISADQYQSGELKIVDPARVNHLIDSIFASSAAETCAPATQGSI